jgi:lipase chaperone LimK
MRITTIITTNVQRIMVCNLGAVLLLVGCPVGVEPTPATNTRLLDDPPSLEGLDVDGALTPSSSGHVVLDEKARMLFDHFLAAEGEVEEAALYARVRVEIDRRLRGPKAEEAWALFLAYVDYRREASDLLQDIDPLDVAAHPETVTSALEEIRARTIGDAPGVTDDAKRLSAALDLWAELSDPGARAEARAQHVAALQIALGDATSPSAPSRILARIHAALAEIPTDDVEA